MTTAEGCAPASYLCLTSIFNSYVNKDWTHKDQDKDEDQSHKDKDKD